MMKAYLSRMLEECAYDAADATWLINTYDRVVAHPQANACFEEAFTLYCDGDSVDHERILRLADDAAALIGAHEYTTELLVYLCLSRWLRERYVRAGVSLSIFHDSMLDLRYKLEECKCVKGIVGSFVAGWFAGFFDMTRFALGRLQFELMPLGEPFEQDGVALSADSLVINVHIPRTGGPLSEAACDEAYARAAAFFADAVGGTVAFVCHSWLLYPENPAILSDRSNIVRFMSRYTLVKWEVDKHKRDLWRLFDTDESHPDRLPTDTSARRAYVRHLQNGGKLGWGFGVYIYKTA